MVSSLVASTSCTREYPDSESHCDYERAYNVGSMYLKIEWSKEQELGCLRVHEDGDFCTAIHRFLMHIHKERGKQFIKLYESP